MTLALAVVLFLASALTLVLAPVLVLAVALVKVLATALVEALVLLLPLILGIDQALARALVSAPLLLQASENPGQICSVIMPPGVTTATGSLRNNPGNFCKSQNLVPEGCGSPLRLKGQRATNHLDQVPSMQDGSESFFFRHGHRRLLTLEPQSPVCSSTTQKDSYQPPGNHSQPVRGKREAMLEMLLHHQICKEVQAEQESTRKDSEVESVTHHDYGKELVQSGPPAPTKPHDYRKEQPETFWLQRAPQLQGVSNIRTLDTPFRKNCSFSTPVPLSLGQPLPYEPENYSHQLGKISSLGRQGGGQGGGGRDKTTPV
ncbi:sperm-associated antigen 8 [Eubalaena glacialis]|uniref:sperm-associated antigen 8 n=1 Tax=Eubalaena glacialis TaxID=27606 RepID=UPI002A5AE0DA|nr:sperm-associated antigen 8 [Eubalaena glacialis]